MTEVPLVEGGLAVVRKTKLYRDLDSGDRDILYGRDVVRTVRIEKRGWVVDSGPGANSILITAADLVAFKDPKAAEKRYKPGDTWVAPRKNPRRRRLR